MAVDDIYTKALLHMNGANGGTTFIDESGKTWTRAGTAQISTARYKFGGASMLSDGNGDYIYGNGSADFAFGTGDFTIDFWLYITSGFNIFDFRPVGTNGDYINAVWNGTNIRLRNSTTYILDGTITVSASAWTHVEISRAGTTLRLFVNGVLDNSVTNSTNWLVGANRPLISGESYNAGVSGINGNYDEFRISKGIARHTAAFIPNTREYGQRVPKAGGVFLSDFGVM